MLLRKRHFNRRSQGAIACLLAGIVLLLNALTASPALHEWFHPDAGQPEHQCAVTMFAHGKVDCASVDVPVPASVIFIAEAPTAAISVFRPVIDHLPAGRAPPGLPAVS